MTFIDETEPPGCSGFIVTRTWTAVDECGNSSTASQTINSQDNEPPTISGIIPLMTVDCPFDSTYQYGNPIIIDDCDDELDIVFEDTLIPGDCPNEFTMRRIWIVTDDCGNSVTARQIIQVVDNEAPTFGCVPAEMTISCDSLDNFILDNRIDICLSDNCDNDVELDLDVVEIPGSCTGNKIIVRTWIAEDACGNRATAVQTITIGDVSPPDIINLPKDITVNVCNGEVVPDPPQNVEAHDVCDINPSLEFSFFEETRDCGVMLIYWIWTASDNCGNIVKDTVSIKVLDCGATDLEASSNSPLCDGQTLMLTASGANDYSWYGPGGFSSSEQNPIIRDVNSSNEGWYYVTSTDGNCGGTDSIYVEIQNGFIDEEEITILLDGCEDSTGYCLPIGEHEIQDYLITDNGSIIESYEIGSCQFDTTQAYNYFELMRIMPIGPYKVDYWIVGGDTISFNFSNIQGSG